MKICNLGKKKQQKNINCTSVWCYCLVCGFGYRRWFYDQTAIKRQRPQPEITSNISLVYKSKASLLAQCRAKLIWKQLMERWKDRRDRLSRCIVSKLLRASNNAGAPRYVVPTAHAPIVSGRQIDVINAGALWRGRMCCTGGGSH